MRGLSRASQDRIADTSGLAGETLNAIQTVQAFTLEELQSERYRRAVEDSFAAAVRRTAAEGLAHGPRHLFMVFAAIVLVLWLGAHQVLARTMTGGQLAQFLVYAAIVGSSAAALSEMWGEVQRAAGAMERLARAPRGAARDQRAAAAARAAAADPRSASASTTSPSIIRRGRRAPHLRISAWT